MNLEKLISHLEETHAKLKLSLPHRLRPYYKNLNLENIRGALIYGQRGVGKTTFLLSISREKPFLYFSADHPFLLTFPLYEVVQKIFSHGYEGVIIDEVHYAKDWSLHLKALYDDYPHHYIWASGSSSLLLKMGVADLSRRFVQTRLPLLSFRDYIYLTSEILVPPVEFFNFQKDHLELVRKVNILKFFREYISSGTRPIFVEGEYCKRIQGIIEKSIFYDIPSLMPQLQSNYLRLMYAVFGYLIGSPVPTINITKLCNSWHIGKEKLYHLLSLLEALELFKIVRKKGDKSVLSKGAKMFINDPSVYHCYRGELGSAREAFVVYSLSEKYEVFASSKEDEYDYMVNNIKLEVGGRKKEHKGADFVISDDLEIPVKNRIPLWLLGMLW